MVRVLAISLPLVIIVALLFYAFQSSGAMYVRASITSASASSMFDSPYYISCDAEILGPTIDLVAIQTVTGGTIYNDYIEWDLTYTPGSSLARIYIDNTMQIVVHGSLDAVSYWTEQDQLKTVLIGQFNELVNEGGIDPSSTLSGTNYKTTLLSGCGKVWEWKPLDTENDYSFSVSSASFKSIRLSVSTGVRFSYLSADLYLNGEHFLSLSASDGSYSGAVRSDLPNSATILVRIHYKNSGSDNKIRFTLFTGDDASYTTYTPVREYLYSRSPGTGFALKEINPKTSHPNQNVDVTVSFDPPTSENINITDRFPASFTLMSDVTIKKYSEETLVGTATVSVTLQDVGMTKQFKIVYTNAQAILGSLNAKEWLTIEYQLRTPSTPAIYTLGIAEIEYLAMFGS